MSMNTWPTEANVPGFFGTRGKHQRLLRLPYPFYYDGKQVLQMSVHEKVHDSCLRVLKSVLTHYGPEEIKRLRLDQYGGCLNVRLKRGSRSQWSMHSWGIAIDFDPKFNALKQTSDTALLARPECAPFWDMWETEGWVSLGRAKNYDWMHVQAARV